MHDTSFTVTQKNRKYGKSTHHCRKARQYRADLSLFLNEPVATVMSEMTVSGSLCLDSETRHAHKETCLHFVSTAEVNWQSTLLLLPDHWYHSTSLHLM